MKHFIMMFLVAATLITLGADYAAAQEHNETHNQSMGAPAKTFNQEYMKAMDDMHGPMMEGIMDQDPDAAFVKGMLPHHKGAVDMAEIELKYGKDPELRKLARDIIEAQDKEIKFMEEWLKKTRLNKGPALFPA